MYEMVGCGQSRCVNYLGLKIGVGGGQWYTIFSSAIAKPWRDEIGREVKQQLVGAVSISKTSGGRKSREGKTIRRVKNRERRAVHGFHSNKDDRETRRDEKR